MILVRSRDAFFEAMIRALKSRNVKVAGADRLKLREHIAVMDLVAAGHAALTPDDDLTLACVLKSPLIGLGEDDLFKLAANRGGPLASALASSADKIARAAARRLAVWRDRARTLTPYAFYASLLGEEGGRKALLSRLGPDAADPIDEFLSLALDHEQGEAPSLTLFLAEVEATERRDQARHGGRKRRRAGVDGSRKQGPRSADRLLARHVRRARRPARPEAPAARSRRAGRTRRCSPGAGRRRRIAKPSLGRGPKSAKRKRASTAACCMSR